MNDLNLIFSIPAYDAMANQLTTVGERGVIQRESFPDGETGLTIETPVAGRNVILVGGTYSDQATLEIFDLSCAIAKYGARSLTLVMPYFGCSTMERATKPGMVVTAKTRARLLSAIPQTREGNRVLLLDLHAEGIPHYFEGNLTAFHVYAKPLILRAVKEISARESLGMVLASTDAGRAKWVESLANDLGIEAAFITKNRLSGSETKVMAVNGNVAGKHVVLYDDMVRSGGSLIGAAEAYKTAGAEKVSLICTHGVFSPTAVEKLAQSELFESIIVTDSHPNTHRYVQYSDINDIKVLPVASLFVPHLILP